MRFLSISAVLPLIAAGLVAQTAAPQANRAPEISPGVKATLLSRPLSFMPNQGQSPRGVEFTANGSGYAMAFGGGSAELSLTAPAAQPESGAAAGNAVPPAQSVRMSVVGSNPAPAVAPRQQLPGNANFIIGNDHSKWHTDVPTYARVQYSGIYPGVDLAYYGNQQQLEYDFVVAPHADASHIALRFDGARAAAQPDGSLLLTVPGGRTISFQKPVVYQKASTGAREQISGAYAIAEDGSVSFTLGTYDHARQLVIDPTLSYASFIGGNEYDQVLSSAVSPQGYLYITGYTSYYQSGAVIYPTTKGAFQPNCNWCAYNQNSAFVTKFSADGSTLIYSTFLEGAYKTGSYGQYPGSSQGDSIAVSVSDQAYVFGTTFDSDFPLASPIQNICRPVPGSSPVSQGCQVVYGGETSGGASFFITQLNSAGNGLVFSTFFGNNSGGYPTSITLDGNNDITLSGSAYAPGSPSINLPLSTNAFQTTFTTGNAVPFVTVLSGSNHGIIYSTWLTGESFCGSGNGTCQPYPGEAVYSNGLIYVTGSTEAGDFPTTSNAYQKSCLLNSSTTPQCNEMNGYLAVFDPAATTGAASAKTITYIHGPTTGQSVYLQSIALDPSGNIFLSGQTNDQKFPVTTTNGIVFGYYVPSANLIIRMAPGGTALSKAAFMGVTAGGNVNIASSVAIDASGNIYSLFTNGNAPVAGGTIPMVNPVQSSQPGQDLQIAEQTNDLSTIRFSTYMGGSAVVTAAGISVDAARNIYVGGETPYQGDDFITTSGAYTTTYPGGEQKGIVEKISGIFATSTTALSYTPAAPLATGNVTITVTVTGSADTTPTGSVAIYGDGTYLVSEPLSNGKLTFTEPANTLGTGAHSVQAIYSGDATYGGSQTTLAYVLNPIVTKTVLSVSPSTVSQGSPVTAKATVTRAQGTGTPTGNVEFFVDGSFIYSAPLTNGVAQFTTPTTGQLKGTYSATATYYGDSVDAGSTSTPVSVTIQ